MCSYPLEVYCESLPNNAGSVALVFATQEQARETARHHLLKGRRRAWNGNRWHAMPGHNIEVAIAISDAAELYDIKNQALAVRAVLVGYNDPA